MADRDTLIDALDACLEAKAFKDYTVNGLQVEGRRDVRRVMSGVTACQALLDEAVAWQADLVLVHHGYFWKNEQAQVTGMKRRRLKTLLTHDINLAAYHLPLDAHPTLGNNARLAERLGLVSEGCLDGVIGRGLVHAGRLSDELMAEKGGAGGGLDSIALGTEFSERLGRDVLVVAGHDRPIKRIAWCTGGAQDYLGLAIDAGVDAFLSGEISERTTHDAREEGVTYFAAGHHATERDGVKALGEWLAAEYGLEHRFVDINNPA